MSYPKLWSDEREAVIQDADKNFDEQIPPKEVQQCTRCVMTNQRPRITFNDEGVCSACQYVDAKNGRIDWDNRRKELDDLLNRYRSKDDGHVYDCVVPCSGGKDSAMVAWKLKHEHGMNPLCATWAPHMYTDIGRKNFDAFVHAGFDVVVAYPNGIFHRKLARLALEFFGDPFIPFIYGQLCWPMNLAETHQIPLVFFGENGEAEYGGDKSAWDKRCWDTNDWARVYMKGASFSRLCHIGMGLGVITKDEFLNASPYYQVGPETAENVQFHWYGYYKKWHPQENYYVATENTGFEANPERSDGTYSKYASLDDKLDGLHYWFGWLKFGIGRCTSDAAHEIRDGDLERGEGIDLVRKYDGEFPSRHFQECLDYLSLDEEHFKRIANRFNTSGVDWEQKMLESHV
jgi:N-acetyl sugar amidotransferase